MLYRRARRKTASDCVFSLPNAPQSDAVTEQPERHQSALLTEALRSGTDIVVASVNDAPHYLGMVDTWFRYWISVGRRGSPPIVPILLTFDVPDQTIASRWRNYVVKVPVPTEAPSALAAQVSRIVWPGSLPASTNRVITTDIDMMPLSLRVIDAARQASEGRFVVARNVLEQDRQFPICYCVAEINTWKAAFGNTDDFVGDLGRYVADADPYSGTHGGAGWFTDQTLLYAKITEWEARGGSILRLIDSETGHRRLDRTSPMLQTFLSAPLAVRQRWTDYHAYPPSRASRALNSWLHFWVDRAKV
jgi:hypothetical protein